LFPVVAETRNGENDMTIIPTGRYRHYKGREYTVLGVARHSETQEELVVYRQEYGDYSLWVRPVTMFQESVEAGGETVRRFRLLESEVTDQLLSRGETPRLDRPESTQVADP
jgi:hypothetical protein